MLIFFCQFQLHADSHHTTTTVPVIPEIDEEINEEELPPLID